MSVVALARRPPLLLDPNGEAGELVRAMHSKVRGGKGETVQGSNYEGRQGGQAPSTAR